MSPEEYRKKANQADLAVSRISDPDLRSAYEKLATSWRHLAHDVEMAERAQGLPARPGEQIAAQSDQRSLTSLVEKLLTDYLRKKGYMKASA